MSATKDKAPPINGNGKPADEPQLPVDSLKEAVAFLRRPFTPEAVKFKIQTNPKKFDNGWGSAMIVTFIDARLVSERLNAVCPHLWETRFLPVDGGMMCELTVDEKTRRDVGHAEKTTTDIGLKALHSDAFKRAAVHFGIGASLYTLPRVYVQASELTQRGDKWFLPRKAEQGLREDYRVWLNGAGEQMFGKPLDHGDLDKGTGDEIDPPVEAEPAVEAAAPAGGITLEKAASLFETAQAASVNGQRLSMWLSSLGIDHETITSKGTAIAALAKLSPDQEDEAIKWFADEMGKGS